MAEMNFGSDKIVDRAADVDIIAHIKFRGGGRIVNGMYDAIVD